MSSFNEVDYYPQLKSWKQKGFTSSEMVAKLKEIILDESAAEKVFQSWKKLIAEKRRKVGFFCCGSGAFLMAIGFFIAFILLDSNSNFHFALYGLTIVGVCLVLKGLVDLIGF